MTATSMYGSLKFLAIAGLVSPVVIGLCACIAIGVACFVRGVFGR